MFGLTVERSEFAVSILETISSLSLFSITLLLASAHISTGATVTPVRGAAVRGTARPRAPKPTWRHKRDHF